MQVKSTWLESGHAERIDQTPNELGDLGASVTVLSPVPNTDLIMFGATDGHLSLYDPSRQEVVKRFKAHSKDVTQIVFTADGKRFLTASIDGFVQWWSTEHLTREQGFSAGSPIYAVAASPGGRYVAAGGHDKIIRVWETNTSELAHQLKDHRDSVTALAWLSDSQLLSGGSGGTVRAWEVDFRRCYRVITAHEDHVSIIHVSPTGDSYMTAGWDGKIRVWTPKHRLRFELPQGPAAVTSAAAIRDESLLAVGYWNGSVVIWDMEKGSVFEEFIAHEENLAGCGVTLNGQLVVTADQAGRIRSWSLETMGVSRFANLHTGETYATTYLPDNREALSVGHDGQIKVWDRNDRWEVACLDPQIGPIMSVAVSPDQRLWALGLGSGEIRLWNATDQVFEGALLGHKDAVCSMRFCAGGQFLVSGSWDMKLKWWSIEKQRAICSMHGHSKEIAAVDVSMDGRYAVSACWDMTARLWDTRARRADYLSEMRCLAGHEGRVLGCAFSPDGEHVATASADQSVRLWLVHKAVDPVVLHGHQDAVTDCQFTPDGRLILTVGRDGKLLIWNREAGEVVCDVQHEGPILSLAIAPDGTQAMIGDEMGRVRFLDLNYERGPTWVAAAVHWKEPPIWLKGTSPTAIYDVGCIYCGRTETIKRNRLGEPWTCKGCGETVHLYRDAYEVSVEAIQE